MSRRQGLEARARQLDNHSPVPSHAPALLHLPSVYLHQQPQPRRPLKRTPPSRTADESVMFQRNARTPLSVTALRHSRLRKTYAYPRVEWPTTRNRTTWLCTQAPEARGLKLLSGSSKHADRFVSSFREKNSANTQLGGSSFPTTRRRSSSGTHSGGAAVLMKQRQRCKRVQCAQRGWSGMNARWPEGGPWGPVHAPARWRLGQGGTGSVSALFRAWH